MNGDSTDILITISPLHFYVINFIPIIILLIISIWLWYFIKKNNKFVSRLIDQQNQLLDDFKSEINNKMSTLAENIVNIPTHNSKKSYNKLFELFHKIKDITNENLYEVMIATKACRIAIYLFHNGMKTPNGISFLKISCIGEHTLIGSGIKERTVKHSNMTINLFDDMLPKFLDTGRYLIINNDDIVDSSKHEFISASKIQYAQLVSIYDANNNTLGFILEEFDHAYNKATADEEYETLRALSQKLTPIFSFSEYADMTLKKIDDN